MLGWMEGRNRMDEQRFSKENNEEQQKQAIQEEHILKNKRHSPATKTDVSWMKQFVLPPRKAGEKPPVSQAWRAGFQSYQKLKQVNKKLSFECVCVYFSILSAYIVKPPRLIN